MKERGKIFNTENVKAILDGRKTMFRVPVKIKTLKNPKKFMKENSYRYPDNSWIVQEGWAAENINCPFGCVGDRLYVRETWAELSDISDPYYHGGNSLSAGVDIWIYYKADNKKLPAGIPWKPLIHMPKKYARIWLEITEVRVERVQDITEEQATMEGMSISIRSSLGWASEPSVELFNLTQAKSTFRMLWDSIYKNWSDNPWVWVCEFKVVKK